MAALDVFIAIFVLLAVLRGARTGFLAGAFSLVGVVVGASVGSRVAHSLAQDGGNPVLGVGVTLISVVAFAVLGEILARVVGGSLRNRISNPASTALDNVGGGALGLALSLVLVWAVGTLTLQSPPLAGLHPVVEQSPVLSSLDKKMPAGLLIRAVSELDPLPEIRGPQPDVAPPEEGIVSDPEIRAAARRAVRVTGV